MTFTTCVIVSICYTYVTTYVIPVVACGVKPIEKAILKLTFTIIGLIWMVVINIHLVISNYVTIIQLLTSRINGAGDLVFTLIFF